MEGGGRREFGAKAKEVARTVQSMSGPCVLVGVGPRASTGVENDRHGVVRRGDGARGGCIIRRSVEG